MTHVSIIGLGAWGTALGLTALRANSQVTFWSHEEKVLNSIKETGLNPYCSPDIKIDPKKVELTSDIKTACQANILVFVVPAQVTREVVERFAPHIQDERFVLLAAKGIENKTGYLLSQIAESALSNCEVAVLSGANFADEVGRNMPATTLIAARTFTTSQWLCQAFNHEKFCAFPSDDIIGAQVAGAFKNVLAVGAGIILETYNCRNLHAAFVTAGFNEMIQIAEALGGRRETLRGQGGLSDIMLSCFSEKSRNMSYGMQFAKGQKDPTKNNTVVEGRETAETITMLADKFKLELPLFTAIHEVLNNGAPVSRLMTAIYES